MLKPIRFWKRFQSSREVWRSPVHIRSAFDESDFGFDDVLGVLATLGKCVAQSSATLRVYAEGGQSYALEDRVIHNPPMPSEGLARWSRRIFGRCNYGLILNYAEQWNDGLTRKVARLLRPLHDRTSIQRHTFEINLFMGNYGYTPFGAHWDDKHSSIIHLHLGPGAKTMTLWSPARYKRITGSERSHFAPGKIVKYGHSYHLRAGDLFLLPPDNFHVGFTRDFSVGIAIVISPQLVKRALAGALYVASEELTGVPAIDNATTLKQALNYIRRAGAPRQPTLPEWVTKSVRRYHLQQQSLLGFCSRPLERSEGKAVTHGKSLVLAAPFQLQCLKDGDTYNLYIRGVEVSLRAHPAIEDLVRQINSGRVISLTTLMSKYSGQVKGEAILHLLNLAYKYCGIDITT
jgi:hypothetical protein